MMGASFFLARAAVAHEAPGNQWQRWLTYPPLVAAYAIVGGFLLLWPFAAVFGRAYNEHGLPAWLGRWVPLAPGQSVPISAGLSAVGIWVAVLALALVARPAILRASLYPFAERVSRWGVALMAGAGLLLALAGAIALRV